MVVIRSYLSPPFIGVAVLPAIPGLGIFMGAIENINIDINGIRNSASSIHWGLTNAHTIRKGK
jgi:hypothetical protein